MSIVHWLIATTLVAQADVATSGGGTAPALPQPTVMRQRLFAIPYQLGRADDPARSPVEVQLYVSGDRGAHWNLYAKGPPTQSQFMFRAGSDGEYWFTIRTVDRSGQVRPEAIRGPGLRVIVDTRPPGAKAAAPRIAEGKGPAGTAVSSRGIGRAGVEGRSAVETAFPGLPPGERPRMVNSLLFDLEYEVDSVGPAGIGRIELWGTRDGGKSWRQYPCDRLENRSLRVGVEEEGLYGFRAVATNGAGLGADPPQSGDLPELWIGVDLTQPSARLVSARQGTDAEAGHLIISWQADDKLLSARPISLAFSESPEGPWTPIVAGLENTGRYAWPIDARLPAQIYIRLEVRDEAGNVGVHHGAQPVPIDQSRPTIRVRDVRPAGA